MPDDNILKGSAFGDASRSRSYAWSHILFRAIWNLVWAVGASWTPPQLYTWRRLLLNVFGAKLAKGARIYGSAKVWYPPNLEMGRGSVIGPGCWVYSMDKIVLEDFAEVAQHVWLLTGTHNTESASFQLYTKPIRICAYAWCAAGSTVGPGVTVGRGAVLGGRAVTFKNLDQWMIYGGNPAKPLRSRRNFESEDMG